MEFFLKNKALDSVDPRRGFTLIETLIVIGIFMLLASLGLFMAFDSFRSSSLRSERDMVVSLLGEARSDSMNNINQVPHGLGFDGTNYVEFEGADYTTGTNKEFIPVGSGTSISGVPSTGISFSQLAGTTTSVTLKVIQGSASSTVSINNEGMIDW